jgi:serine O-acetyltransferase
MPFSSGDGKLCPRIGNDVSIGAFAMVFGPLLVGDRSRIGPNVVVADDVAPDSALIVPRRGRPQPAERAPVRPEPRP